MLTPKYFWWVGLFIIGIAFCQSSPSTETTEPIFPLDSLLVTLPLSKPETFNYNLENPSKQIELPGDLKEISGLSYDAADSSIYTHNDETGTIFKISSTSGEIVNRWPFAGPGDYEGIEVRHGQVYITESKGNIWTFDLASQSSAGEIKTALSQSNDVEGLVALPNSNTLLLACKGKNTPGKKLPGDALYKSVYALNLVDSSLHLFFTLSQDTLKTFVNKYLGLEGKKLEKRLSRISEFSPSGIAIHPLSGDIYILSSVENTLVVLDEKKLIKHILFLKEDFFNQPEGICFDQIGRLFISNEGDDFTPSQLLIFDPLSY